MSALGVAESLRFTIRNWAAVEHEYAAGAPLGQQRGVTPPPSWKCAVLYASELLVAYEIKQPHNRFPGDKIIGKLWWACPLAMAVVYLKNGVANIRIQPPSQCPLPECQMP